MKIKVWIATAFQLRHRNGVWLDTAKPSYGTNIAVIDVYKKDHTGACILIRYYAWQRREVLRYADYYTEIRVAHNECLGVIKRNWNTRYPPY